MKYDKFTFTIINDSEENREILMAFISELPFESFNTESSKFEAFAPINSITKEELESLIELAPFSASFTCEQMDDINWNEEWEKKYFKPLIIGNTCLVRAPFHADYPNAEYEIIINPNMSFGTGNHETTSLMIEYINETKLHGKSVLDMGCGTGILSIYASKKDASYIRAIDIDKWAYDSVKENCVLNSISNINCSIGDASLLSNEETYDVILANIHKNIIIADLPKYVSSLKQDGLIILSGFYKDDISDVSAIANSLKLQLVCTKERNNWVAVCYKLCLEN